MVTDKQWFVFPCWHCNVLLSACISPVSAPSPLFCLFHPVLNYPTALYPNLSVSHPPSLPPPIPVYLPPIPTPTSHCLSYCHLMSPPPPHHLCEPATEWYCPLFATNGTFIPFFPPSLWQFVSLPFIIASLHKPAHPHLSFSHLFSLPPILISPFSLCHSFISYCSFTTSICSFLFTFGWLSLIYLHIHRCRSIDFLISHLKQLRIQECRLFLCRYNLNNLFTHITTVNSFLFTILVWQACQPFLSLFSDIGAMGNKVSKRSVEKALIFTNKFLFFNFLTLNHRHVRDWSRLKEGYVVM